MISKNNAGFTVIEVIVAVFILSVTLSGISAALVSNNNLAVSVTNNYIASGLVQEGVEVVRSLRDRDYEASPARTFGSFGSDGVVNDGIYRVQFDSAFLLPNPPDDYLKLDSTSGIYSYDGGENSIFKRTVAITTVVPNVEKRVVVTVSWNERSISKSVSAEEHLFNWK